MNPRIPSSFRLFRPASLAFTLCFAAGVLLAEEGFVDLFNGRDLSGWVNVNCAPETWSWRDGLVHCTGKPTGALRTERQYENFILELEWRHLKSGGNAGVFLWASALGAPGVPFLRAIEVQVLDHGYGKSDWFTTHGDVFPIHGSSMKPFGRHNGMRSFPSEERSKGTPEWNHYRMVCTNGVLRLSVNGKEVSGGEQCTWRKGYIGLESEGSPVEFRNVRIKELPSGNAAAADSAPAQTGFVGLYNGLDLRGWREAGVQAARWAADDWQLQARAGDGGQGTLWTDRVFGDGEWIVDCRIAEEGTDGPSAALRLRGGEAPGTSIPLGTREGDWLKGTWMSRPLKAGAWHRLSVRMKGRQVTVRVGGEVVANGLLPEGAPETGSLGLVSHGKAVTFANLYWRGD
jgi:hypothetical protein